ncbi:MAG TPA: alpha/beta hydrolase [Acidimicrobiales bacterium]
MIPVVLVHGGSFAGSCWDRLVPYLDGSTLAVDLPGRGRHPAPPASVTIEAASRSVVGDIDEAGFDEVILVGHSLAGSSLPATVGLLGRRVRHVVLVACTVPSHGQSALDTLPSEVQEMVRVARDAEPGVLDDELARAFFGNDLDAEQFAWCKAQMVPEGLTLVMGQVDHTPLRVPVPRTWVRPLRDAIVDPEKQLEFARNVGDCPVIDIDAGHMCMISQPRRLAEILNGIADQ